LNKRIHFLNQLAEALDLENVSFVHDRAEIYGKGDYRASYDIVTARAVARLAVLREVCLPLVKEGGQLIDFRSAKGEEAVEEPRLGIGVLGGKLHDVISYELPEDAGERQIIKRDKRSEAPKKYPRKPGMPNKSPLLEKEK